MFKKSKEKRAERAAEAAEAQRQASETAAQHERDVIAWCITTARAAAAGTIGPVAAPIALKAGESALYAVEGAGLVEPRRGAGQWQGGSQSVSVRIPGTKSMRYRVGGTRGTYVQGEEKPTLIDSGTVTITDQQRGLHRLEAEPRVGLVEAARLPRW